ncbi:MAG: TraM recognition domain-containing protein, partial [Candidatus Weimeria sp.]
CSIVIQAISQLKQHYKDSWNTIAGNCDTKLFLGSDDNETIKWLIETTGKRTVKTGSSSYQTKGGGSTSISTAGEDLVTPDRVTMLNEDECIVRIRGLPIYQGPKYKTFNHPAFKYAMSTKGQFHVKNRISKDQKFKLLPLWQQLELKDKGAIKAMAASSEDGGLPVPDETDKKNVKKEEVPALGDKNPKDERPHMDKTLESIKNKARRKEAKEAEATAKAIEEGLNSEAEPLSDEIVMTIADTFGITADDTDEDIRRKLDAYIELAQPDMSEVEYTLAH